MYITPSCIKLQNECHVKITVKVITLINWSFPLFIISYLIFFLIFSTYKTQWNKNKHNLFDN